MFFLVRCALWADFFLGMSSQVSYVDMKLTQDQEWTRALSGLLPS